MSFSNNDPDANLPEVQQSQAPTPANPNPAPVQSQPATPAQPAQATQGQPVQPTPPKPSLHARIFDSILQGMSGGPTVVTDENGNRRLVPQSRTSMGKSIVAAALTGVMTPHTYRDTPYGPTTDFSKTGADAFNAGKKVVTDRDAEVQKQFDDARAKKLTTISNNIKLAQQTFALAAQQHQVLDSVVERNNSTILKDAAEYDSQVAGDPSQKAIVAKNLTYQQALQALNGKMTSQNAIVDGTVDVRNAESGVIEPHPTYTILNPDVKIRLSQATTDELAKFNRSFDGLFDATGGNVTVPLRAAVSYIHQANTLQSAENFFTNAQKELNPDAKPFDLVGAVKKDPSLNPAIDSLEKSLAQHLPVYQVLDVVRQSPNGNKLLSLIGTPDQVDKYIADKKNDALKAQSIANAAGKVELKEAPKPTTPQEQAQLKHTELENKKLENDLNGQQRLGDVTKTGDDYLNTLSAPDQAQLRAIHEGRQGLSESMLRTKDGQRLSTQLNTAYPDFDSTKYPAYAAMRKDMTSGKASVGINRFNTALRHLDTMYQHVNAWSTIPGLKTLSALAGGDAAKLDTDRTAVAEELAAAYKGGVASKSEVDEWNEKLKVSSPAELRTNLKEVAELLKGKLDAYQNQWNNAAPKGVVTPIRIIGPEAKQAIERVTGEKLAPVVGDIQVGPQNIPYRFDGTQWVKQKAGQ